MKIEAVRMEQIKKLMASYYSGLIFPGRWHLMKDKMQIYVNYPVFIIKPKVHESILGFEFEWIMAGEWQKSLLEITFSKTFIAEVPTKEDIRRYRFEILESVFVHHYERLVVNQI